MARLTYMGQDGEAYKFSTDGGLQFSAFVDDSIQSHLPQIGQVLEAVYETKTSKAGKQYNKVTSINGNAAQPRQGGGGFQRGGGRPAPTYDPRTFVSNVVGQAIAAKAITKPEELSAWATEAFRLIKAIEPATVKAQMGTQPAAPPSPTPVAAGAAPTSPAPLSDQGDAIPF